MPDGAAPARRRVIEPVAWDAELDPRERKFVELYLETNNQTTAALAAGYGRNYNSAASIASQLLKRLKIKNAVDKRNAEIMAALDFTPDRILREIAKVAGVNSGDFITIDDEGNPVVDFSEVTRAQLAAVSGVESETYIEGRGDFARPVKRVKYKTHDKLKALDMLAKLSRMYPAEPNTPHSGPQLHLHAHAHKIDIASLEPEQRAQLRGVLLALKNKSGDNSDEDA